MRYSRPIHERANLDNLTKKATPEQRLWSQVLFVAIKDYSYKPEGGEEANNFDKERFDRLLMLKRDAESWFTSREFSEGSFLWISEILDLQPDVILAGIKNIKKKHRNQQIERVDYRMRTVYGKQRRQATLPHP
jgi:hypothetical protein